VGSKWLEIGYNPKDIWSYSRLHKQDPEREKHPTQKPLAIIDRIIKVSSPKNGIVLDPFMGSGTTAISCIRNSRQYTGFEVNKDYCKMIQKRIIKENNNLFNQLSTKTLKEIKDTTKNQSSFWETKNSYSQFEI